MRIVVEQFRGLIRLSDESGTELSSVTVGEARLLSSRLMNEVRRMENKPRYRVPANYRRRSNADHRLA